MDYSAFEHLIGYQFKDKALLQLALTHCSFGAPNNQRLEFLGDAVLDVVISDFLFKRYPNYSEGELSRARAWLVSGEQLSKIAKSIQLQTYICCSTNKKFEPSQMPSSILADALEAIIAAVYLDSGMSQVKTLVKDVFGDLLAAPKIQIQTKDFKTQLQETLQANQIPLPTYELIKQTGKHHDLTFYVKLSVAGFDYSSLGQGKSLRQAEQESAKRWLEFWENERKK